MDKKTLHRNNHYVPTFYLKRFASSDGSLWIYRILVSDSSVPLWKKSSAKGIAYHPHLYTWIDKGEESDEFEDWLAKEFESPAASAFEKVISGTRLTPYDWKCIIRFTAAQDVRTPGRLIENLEKWYGVIPGVLEKTLQVSVEKLGMKRELKRVLDKEQKFENKYLPLRITTRRVPGQKYGEIKAEITVGRRLWLFSMHHLLTNTLNALEKQRWAILEPPDGLSWFTSDKPVIRLNYYRSGEYNLMGGWGNPGTEILLPLSPKHLLYTKIGYYPPKLRVVPHDLAIELQKIIAENAHRFIFASDRDPNIPKLHPRTVNPDAYRKEAEQWNNWHTDQSDAERK